MLGDTRVAIGRSALRWTCYYFTWLPIDTFLATHALLNNCISRVACHRYCDHCLSVDACSSLLQTTRHVAAFALSIHLRSAQCLSIACAFDSFPFGRFSQTEPPWLPGIIRPWSLIYQNIIHKHASDFHSTRIRDRSYACLIQM